MIFYIVYSYTMIYNTFIYIKVLLYVIKLLYNFINSNNTKKLKKSKRVYKDLDIWFKQFN